MEDLHSQEMAVPFTRPRYDWMLPRGRVALGRRTLLMGIVNVTPDSFSDGGRHVSVAAAVAHGLRLLDEGADLLDVGAESTRPGATALAAEEEQARLLPVVRGLRAARPEALLSIDTYHARTAAAALRSGADVINDVSGMLWDRAMGPTLGAARPVPGVVLMQARGRPTEWSGLPALAAEEVLPLVRTGLAERLQAGMACGLPAETMVLDPGFGFGKRGAENDVLLAGLAELHALRRPLLIGLSRKGFLAGEGKKDDAASEARLHATIAANTAAVLAGAHVLRVHDVAAGRAAVTVGDRVLRMRERTRS